MLRKLYLCCACSENFAAHAQKTLSWIVVKGYCICSILCAPSRELPPLSIGKGSPHLYAKGVVYIVLPHVYWWCHMMSCDVTVVVCQPLKEWRAFHSPLIEDKQYWDQVCTAHLKTSLEFPQVSKMSTLRGYICMLPCTATCIHAC